MTVKPVVNAMRILRHLAATGTPMRGADIARQLDINSSTCFNILRTLVAEEAIDFNPQSKMYSAGLGLIRLVGQVVSQGQRLQRAAPLMLDFAIRHKVTVTLWRRLGDDRIVLVSSESSPNDLHINMPAGQRLPILMGASGRLFAPDLGLSDRALRSAFTKIRWARALSFETYMQGVSEARERGWAIDDGYFAAGVVSLAAPIKDLGGKVTFAVSAVVFRGILNKDATHALGDELHRLGDELQSILF